MKIISSETIPKRFKSLLHKSRFSKRPNLITGQWICKPMRDEFDSQKERIRIHDCLAGVGVPSNLEGIQELGWKLAQLAQAIGVEFQFNGLTTERLSDLEPDMFETRPQSESLVVNSVFKLHPVLAQPGSIEKLLATVKAIKPSIVTVVEQETNHNDVVFLDRFNEALHYYSSLFDSLEDGVVIPSEDRVMSEVYLGRQILNVVAVEGTDPIERHETLAQWRKQMGSAGFDPVNFLVFLLHQPFEDEKDRNFNVFTSLL